MNKKKNQSQLGLDSVAYTVIPATEEAEIRRLVVQDQPGQIVHKTPCQPIKKLSTSAA
jgi:hypothetical protein